MLFLVHMEHMDPTDLDQQQSTNAPIIKDLRN
jgi:hypothetical protein